MSRENALPDLALGGRIMTDTILSLKNIEKSFDDTGVLKNISLDVGRGEFVTL